MVRVMCKCLFCWFIVKSYDCGHDVCWFCFYDLFCSVYADCVHYKCSVSYFYNNKWCSYGQVCTRTIDRLEVDFAQYQHLFLSMSNQLISATSGQMVSHDHVPRQQLCQKQWLWLQLWLDHCTQYPQPKMLKPDLLWLVLWFKFSQSKNKNISLLSQI